MSFGRPLRDGEVRDVDADYLAAYQAEYAAYKAAGLDRADEVAEILDGLGHPVKAKAAPKKTPAKQRAVAADTTEKAVEGDVNPK